MPVINGIYTKDFPDLGRDGLGTDLIPVAITGNVITYKVTLSSLMALYATLASPTFTGTPAAPTAAPGTNTTQLATTAFVIANAPTISFGSFGSTANAQGGSYSAGTITLQPASASFPGGVTTGTQTFAGSKTFSSTLTASGSIYANLFEFGSGQTLASRAANANFIYSGTSGLNFSDNTGAVTLASLSNAGAFTLNSLTSGLVKSTAGLLSNAVAGTDYLTPSGDGSGLSGVVLTTTNQSIADTKTFTSGISLTGGGFVVNGDSGSTTLSAIDLRNTGGTTRLGTVGSSASGIFTGSSAYATVFGSSTNTPIEFGLNGNIKAIIATTGSISSTPQGTLYGTASGSITSSQLATSLTDETGTGVAVFATSPTLTTPNIGAATFSTLTGGTASTIAWANTSTGNVTNSMSIRNGGTSTGTGNGINFVTGTALNSARINSVLTSTTEGDLVFTTMTASVLGEAGRFLSDKTLSLTGGLTVPAAGTVTFTSAANVYMPTVIREGGTGNAFFQYSTDTRFISLNNAGKVAIRNNANSADNLTLTDAGGLALPQYGAGTLTTDASGNVTATSDERMKNISAFYTVGLDALKNIKPITYKWKTDTKLDTKEFYTGFSAQNVHQNIPQAAGKMANGDLTIQDRPIMATMINAINELNAKIIALEARIKLLEK